MVIGVIFEGIFNFGYWVCEGVELVDSFIFENLNI